MTIHGRIPIRAYLVLSPGPDGPVSNVVQSREVAAILATEPGARAYLLEATLAQLIDAGCILATLEASR